MIFCILIDKIYTIYLAWKSILKLKRIHIKSKIGVFIVLSRENRPTIDWSEMEFLRRIFRQKSLNSGQSDGGAWKRAVAATLSPNFQTYAKWRNNLFR